MDTGAYGPFDSMVWEPCGCIIGDASARAIPLGRLSTVRDSLRRCAYTAILETVMSRGKSGAEPAVPRNRMGGSTPICYNRVNSKLLLTVLEDLDRADAG